MNLPPRLQADLRLTAVISLLPRCNTIADIGCDHGKLALTLLHEGKCDRVIAADVSHDSLTKARINAASADVHEAMDIRLGDGLSVLRVGEANAAVLAGMGGALIAQLIAKEELLAKKMVCLILQPMQQAAVLRKYLRECGFVIDDERMLREGRWIYEILRVRAGVQQLPSDLPAELADEIGPILWQKRDPLIAERLRHKAKACRQRLREAMRGETAAAREGQHALKERIAALEHMIGIIEAANKEAT